jgi:2',3'-cyclic-nucleotide 2'-phosphodiesterase
VRILYFGDIFGKPGRVALKYALKKLTSEYDIDFVIVNGENAAHGKGITEKIAESFFSYGIDVITTGNHVWDQREIIPYFEKCDKILRPANFPDDPSIPGRGSVVVKCKKNPSLKLGVIHLMGRVFMDPLECPFREAEVQIKEVKRKGASCILVDFHAEATAEKQAFAHFLDGKVSAVVGSHSHVQTADEKLLPWGTAAITDVGMTGCFDSVIGVKKELSIQKFLTKMPVRYEPAEGPGGYGAVIIEIDEESGKAQSILRLREERV